MIRSLLRNNLLAVEEKIQIDHPRSPARTLRPPHLALDPFQGIQKLPGSQPRPDLRNGVDEPGLILESDRFRPVEGGAAEETYFRNRSDAPDGIPALDGRISQIGTDPDEGDDSPHLFSGRLPGSHFSTRYPVFRPRTSCMS